MTNEEFQSLVLQQLGKINKRLDSLEEGQLHLATRLDNVDNKVDKLELRLENEVIDKVRALFDGFALRGDQIERLQKHLDERLDSIETDTRYLVARVARLEKLAK
jgi:predicted nuclease with TOPRIM domain